jgi:hypothetical protein
MHGALPISKRPCQLLLPTHPTLLQAPLPLQLQQLPQLSHLQSVVS